MGVVDNLIFKVRLGHMYDILGRHRVLFLKIFNNVYYFHYDNILPEWNKNVLHFTSDDKNLFIILHLANLRLVVQYPLILRAR